jgi:hypothetical protein
VSGQFKTGQQTFCISRSVIDTCIKRGVDVMDALNAIAILVPAEWLLIFYMLYYFKNNKIEFGLTTTLKIGNL